MKKVLTLLAVAGMFSFVACGPKEENKEAAEQPATEQVQEEAPVMQEEAAPEMAAADSTAVMEAAPAQEGENAAE